jgi:hypothetical protein
LASGNVPVQQQQAAYAIPGQAATQYAGAAMPTLIAPWFQAAGMGGSSTNYYNPYAQQTAGMNALLTGMGQLDRQYNQPGSWLNNMWGGGGSTTNIGGESINWDLQ